MITDTTTHRGNDITIRPLRPEDRGEICMLLQETGNFSTTDVGIGIEVLDDALDDPEGSGYRILSAVTSEGRLAGYICYGAIPLTVGCFDLYWIATGAAWMRAGIGARLLEAMEQSLIAEQARHVYVDTSSTSGYAPAHAFYEKHGYRVAAVLEDFTGQVITRKFT